MYKEQIKTMSILKYGSITDMLDLWVHGKIDLTDIEKEIILEHMAKVMPDVIFELKEYIIDSKEMGDSEKTKWVSIAMNSSE